MGYEIIYKAFTIKKNDTFIPVVVIGSNNCWEQSWNGRQRRERNLWIPKSFFNGKYDFNSLTEMEQNFAFDLIQKDMNGGMLQGKYKSPQSLLNAFKKYVFNSKELPIKPELVSMYYFKSLHNGTDDEEDKIIAIFEKYLENQEEILTEKEMYMIVNKSLCKIADINTELRERFLQWRTKEQLLFYSYSDYEHKIDRLFKEKYSIERKKPKTDYEIYQELKDEPQIVFKKENLKDIVGKTIIAFGNFGHNELGIGKIKPLYSNDEYGFFQSKKRRYYIPLYRLYSYKLVR